MVNKNLKQLFESWNEKSVNYCILRNYDFLLKNEDFYNGKDIDILISSSSLDKAELVLKKIGFIKLDLNFASNHCGYILFDINRIISIHLHINGVSGKNIQYLNGENILKRKIKFKYFYHTSKKDLFLVIFMHLIFDKSQWKDSYKRELHNLIDFININDLDIFFSNNYSKMIISLIKNNKFELLIKKRGILKKNFYRNNLKLIFSYIKFYFLSFIYFLKRIFIKKGKLVAIVGLDGTGKTTAINSIDEYFKNSLLRNKILYLGRGKNNIIPIHFLANLLIKKNINKKNIINCEELISPTIGKKKKFNLLFTLSSFIFFFDLYLRYLFHVYPLKIKNDIILSDRYITDIILMNGVPYYLKFLLFLLLPKPDIFIYLYNDLDILNKRKGHPIEDLKRQKEIYSLLLKKYGFIKIKSISKDQTFKDILNIIEKKF